MRKPAGWHRLATPHEIYRVGQVPLVVAYGQLAIAHALAVARSDAGAAGRQLVVGIVRTTAPRQWCLGLAHPDGTLTWLGQHQLLREAEAHVGAVAALCQHLHRDPDTVASVVTALTAVSEMPS